MCKINSNFARDRTAWRLGTFSYHPFTSNKQ